MSNFTEVRVLIANLIAVVDNVLQDFQEVINAGGVVTQTDLDEAKAALTAEINKVTAADPVPGN